MNPYQKTEWIDHIVDIDTGAIIQQGTRFNSQRANNIENGIYNAYETIEKQNIEIQRLMVQIEINGRVTNGSNAFFDNFDGKANKMDRLASTTTINTAVPAGATVLNVDSINGFAKGTQVTVFDGSNQETKMITDVGTTTITVQALTNSYVKGATVARSNVKIVNAQITKGDWGTYTVAVTEVI